jgi:hypothetical protein
MAAGRQPGRCPNVGGALRAATKRQAGLCPATPPGRPWALPRNFVALQFLPYGRIARDSLHRTQGPLVLSCGDSDATRGVGLVGLVEPVRRFPGCRVRRRPVLARTRALQMARPPGTAGSRGTFAAYGASPSLVSHLVSHLVVPGPIRILLTVLLYMILPHPFGSQWSCRHGMFQRSVIRVIVRR